MPIPDHDFNITPDDIIAGCEALEKGAATKTDRRTWLKRNEIILSAIVGCVALAVKGILYFNPAGPLGSALEFTDKIAADHTVKKVTTTVFSRTVTAADRDQHGNIRVFRWDERFRPGDIIEIKADLPPGAGEIHIYRGPQAVPAWKTTRNGRFRGTVEHVPLGEYYYLWLDPKKNIQTTVRITRSSAPEHAPEHI